MYVRHCIVIIRRTCDRFCYESRSIDRTKNNEIDHLRQQRQSVQGEIDGLSAEIDSLNQEAAIILAQQSDLLQAIEGLIRKSVS